MAILKRRSAAARTWTGAVAGAAVIALAVAGCGGSSGAASSGGKTTAYGASSSTKAAKPAKPAGSASVALASSKLGKILVDGKGRTLYLFEADKGKASACNGACASIWPPLTTAGHLTAGPGLVASKLGTIKRSDGSSEATYNGHPLYTYAGDSAPGQTTGQGSDDFGAEWYVLSAAGSKLEKGG